MVEADAEELTGLRKALYAMHLKMCPACQAHRKQVDTTIATLGALPKEQPSEEAREKALSAFRRNKKEGV